MGKKIELLVKKIPDTCIKFNSNIRTIQLKLRVWSTYFYIPFIVFSIFKTNLFAFSQFLIILGSSLQISLLLGFSRCYVFVVGEQHYFDWIVGYWAVINIIEN